MNSLVIGFSGKKGSGKTELSNALSKSLGWKHVGFGDYVRDVCRQRGLDLLSVEVDK